MSCAVDVLAAAGGHDHLHGAHLASEAWITFPRARPSECSVRGSDAWCCGAGRGRVRSVVDDRPRLAPLIKVGAAPRNGARAESNGIGKLPLRDQAVDRRPTQAGHSHDAGHAQKDWRRGVDTG